MKEIFVDKPIRMATFFLLLICIWPQISTAQTIGGRVADEKGHAISGVKVKVVWYDSPGHMDGGECITDAQGRWQVVLPADIRDVYISLDHPDYISDKSYRKDKPPMSRLRDGTSVVKGAAAHYGTGSAVHPRARQEERHTLFLLLPADRATRAVNAQQAVPRKISPRIANSPTAE